MDSKTKEEIHSHIVKGDLKSAMKGLRASRLASGLPTDLVDELINTHVSIEKQIRLGLLLSADTSTLYSKLTDSLLKLIPDEATELKPVALAEIPFHELEAELRQYRYKADFTFFPFHSRSAVQIDYQNVGIPFFYGVPFVSENPRRSVYPDTK
ncbi:MAG: hypothetical protein AAFQ87_25375, partial [Bacteroidota bacterium]